LHPLSTSPSTRLVSIAYKLGISLASAVVLLLACEGLLRWCGYADGAALYFDPDVGLRYYPDQHRHMLVNGVDAGSVTTNRWGFRGPSFEMEKRAEVRRVVCLGDSYTLGWAVDDADVYPRRLQEWCDVHAESGRYEVLNLGQPDFNTVNEARLYDTFARKLQPEVVVLAYVLNDLQPETLGPVNMNSRLEHFLGSTATLRALRYHLFPQLGVYQYGQNAENSRRRAEYLMHADEILCNPGGELAKPFWSVSLTALRKIVNDVRRDGAELLLVVFPSRFQLDRVRALAEKGTLDAQEEGRITLAQARLQREAAVLGVPFLDLWPAFREAGPAAFGVLDREHPSAEGHRLAAEEIGKRILALTESR
jgi:lysophospholipase L1-like esterase